MLWTLSALIALSALGQTAPAAPVKTPMEDLKIVEPLRLVRTGFQFTEGPIWDAKHRRLLFSDIPANRIYALDPDGELSVFAENTKAANGLAIHDDEVFACQGDAGMVGAFHLETKAHRVVADTFGGVRFNAPNDLAIAKNGDLYFTDPKFGDGKLTQPKMSVYFVPKGGKARMAIPDLPWPNGIAYSLDEKTLYVHPTGDAFVRAYAIEGPGKLGPERRIFETPDHGGRSFPGGDGMTLDAGGNLYVTVPMLKQMIALDPAGKNLLRVDLPENPTNCTFGGADRDWLYITASSSVYALRLNRKGR
ncbi:MAG: SMP-30/gluconolactonase/LRE family protein [Fimbriimonadaceae bacterium]|nr:SMP-30/gluconolactonase/LRE family protein [Fimbriimonadaceae bacterium]